MLAEGTVRVLVVDDSPLVREGVRQLLCFCPGLCVVAEAANGKEALAQVERFHPDVLVMDIHMPVLGGLAALESIQRVFWPRPAVIMISADPGEEYRRRALSLGAAGFVAKGDLGGLPAAVRAVACQL